MAVSFFPRTDTALLAWSLNFSTLITATPTAYGLTSAQATAYAAVHAAYGTALAACEPGSRNKSAVVAKNTARTNLKTQAKLLANLVNGTATVTNAQKVALGLNVRAKPQPIPVPSNAPGLDVVSVSAWTVKIKLHDSAAGSGRGKPAGVSGASVFSYVGAVAPTDIAQWKFEGSTGRTAVDIAFPSTLAPGVLVWLAGLKGT
jgi:hypothetical protein